MGSQKNMQENSTSISVMSYGTDEAALVLQINVCSKMFCIVDMCHSLQCSVFFVVVVFFFFFLHIMQKVKRLMYSSSILLCY